MTEHDWHSSVRVKLGSIVSLKTGKLNSNASNPKGMYPFFTCSQDNFRTDTYSFDTEAVLLAGNNANGIYPLKYYKGKFDVYQRTYVIGSLDETRVSNRYLYYALQRKLKLLQSISTGAATKFLALTILKDIDLDLPPISTQRKIATILWAYDDLIEKNMRRIQILEQMAQLIYRDWFMNFHFPGHEKVRMVDSELGKIPEGWRVARLEAIAEIVKVKFSEKEHAELPLLDLARIPRRSSAVTDLGHWSEITTSRIVFKKGDVLFGSIRPYLHKVVMAPCNGVTNVSVFVIQSRHIITRAFLLTLLFSDDTIAWATQHSGGTKMPVIKWGLLEKMMALIPPTGLLQQFDQLVYPMLDSITLATMRNLNLRRTRDLLLPKLISGELDVSEVDIHIGGEAE